MKYSKQRQLILDIINKSELHPTAEMIYEEARIIIPNISLGTIYRNLESLEKNDLIKHIIMSNNSDRYDKNVKDHYHFYCEECHKIYDIFSASLININELLSNETGHKINSNTLVFSGICKYCQRKGKQLWN